MSIFSITIIAVATFLVAFVLLLRWSNSQNQHHNEK